MSWTVPTAQSPTCRSQTGSRSTSEGAGPSPSSLCNPASPCWGGMKEWDEPAASWVGGGTQHTEPPRVTNAAQIHKHHEIPAAARHNVVAEVTPRGPVIIHLVIPHPIPTLWEHSLFFQQLSLHLNPAMKTRDFSSHFHLFTSPIRGRSGIGDSFVGMQESPSREFSVQLQALQLFLAEERCHSGITAPAGIAAAGTGAQPPRVCSQRARSKLEPRFVSVELKAAGFSLGGEAMWVPGKQEHVCVQENSQSRDFIGELSQFPPEDLLKTFT